MPVAANTKHYAALCLLAVGVVGLLVSGSAIYAGFSGNNGEVLWGPLALGAVGVLVCLFLIRSGVRIRNRAVEQGSTAHLDPAERGPTSYTEVAKPSFLRGKDEG